ncbi:hypothetical protein FHU41_000246 [Psychromicrobium silvestre]|uniref:Uncharacterized protein n=1 Tax=Psychromicrobium silvestre TaxID=1645614 RepID=A0A7Y9S4M3_9MICC|nr:DUF4192 family protein [Psychromicrobium silvestre]NYE94025.1 hypothetical protein [Psychromicrobium silvestre]
MEEEKPSLFSAGSGDPAVGSSGRGVGTLSINSPEDLLGYLPHALGYWPECSLMVLGLKGKQAGASLRLDLPDRHGSEEECLHYASQLVACLTSSVPGSEAIAVDGVVLALFTGLDWRDGEDPGYDRLMTCLLRELDIAGMSVREAWWIGQTSWQDSLQHTPTCQCLS